MMPDFAEIHARLPKFAGRNMDLHAVRRKNEMRKLLEAHLAGSAIQITRMEGDSPYGVSKYYLMLDVPHLVYTSFKPLTPDIVVFELMRSGRLSVDSVSQERLLPVSIELPNTHPDRANPPKVRLLDHRVFHPSVFSSALCATERWKPTTFLVDMLAEIAALLRFEREANLKEPLNPLAAKWFEEGHRGFDLPLR